MRLFDWNKHSFTILHIPSIFINKNQLQRPRWLLFRKDDLKCTLCWHKHKHHSLGNEYQNRLITDPMLLANFGIFLKETSTYISNTFIPEKFGNQCTLHSVLLLLSLFILMKSKAASFFWYKLHFNGIRD